jgi:hypothetical protein
MAAAVEATGFPAAEVRALLLQPVAPSCPSPVGIGGVQARPLMGTLHPLPYLTTLTLPERHLLISQISMQLQCMAEGLESLQVFHVDQPGKTNKKKFNGVTVPYLPSWRT